MPVIETLASSEQLQKKKSLELAWDPLTGESLLDQVLVVIIIYWYVLSIGFGIVFRIGIGICIGYGYGIHSLGRVF